MSSYRFSLVGRHTHPTALVTRIDLHVSRVSASSLVVDWRVECFTSDQVLVEPSSEYVSIPDLARVALDERVFELSEAFSLKHRRQRPGASIPVEVGLDDGIEPVRQPPCEPLWLKDPAVVPQPETSWTALQLEERKRDSRTGERDIRARRLF